MTDAASEGVWGACPLQKIYGLSSLSGCFRDNFL